MKSLKFPFVGINIRYIYFIVLDILFSGIGYTEIVLSGSGKGVSGHPYFQLVKTLFQNVSYVRPLF